MEHIQTIFERICNEDVEQRKLSVRTVRSKNGYESFFNGKSIGVNLSYSDITAFYAGQEYFYRTAIGEMMSYRDWLCGIGRCTYADYYIAECRRKISDYKIRKRN